MKQKVAIISDIHANKYALNRFIEYIESENITKVLNLGDFVQKGPNPCEVVDILLSDKRFVNIIGNNERKILQMRTGLVKKNREHQEWTINMLGKERIDKISRVQPEKIIEIDSVKMLMLHSRKKDGSDFPLIYSTNTADDFVNDYDDYDVDLICFGHTHEPLYFRWMGNKFINPGSLGCSRESKILFVILELEAGKITDIDFKSLYYDNTNLVEDYIKNDVPDKELLLKFFHGYTLK